MTDKGMTGLLDREEIAQEVQEGNTPITADAEAAAKLMAEQTKLAALASQMIRDIADEQGRSTEYKRKSVEATIRFASMIMRGFSELIEILESNTPEADEVRQVFPDLETLASDPVIKALGPHQIGLMGRYLEDLLPHLVKELEKSGEESISVADFFEIGEDGKVDYENSLYLKSLQAADAADAERNRAEVKKLAEVVQCMAPASNHTMPNNALMNAMQQKNPINAGAFDLIVSNETKRRKEITSYAVVAYDDPTGPELLTTNLTEYERQVSDAVMTLWEAAKEQGVPPVFTADMIHRAMPGGGDKPSAQQRGAITRTVEKLRHLHVTVDATEEMRQRGLIEKGESFELDDFFLSATRGTKRFSNRKDPVTAYQLNTEPMILRYAKMTKQVLRTSAQNLEIRKVKDGRAAEIVAMSADRQAMTGYMLRRILVMRNDRDKAREALKNYNKRRKREPDLEELPLSHFCSQSRTILFDTLFHETGTATDNKQQTKRNRDFCFEALEYWRVTGLIKEYTEQTKGRSITGVRIEL